MTARCPVRTPVECALAMGHDPPCSPRIEDEFPNAEDEAAAAAHYAEMIGLNHTREERAADLAERLAALDLVGTFAVSTIEEDDEPICPVCNGDLREPVPGQPAPWIAIDPPEEP